MKNRILAALLAAVGGTLGLQKFYLGNARGGLLSVLFCWTMIPTIIGLVEATRFLNMDERIFQKLYVDPELNDDLSPAQLSSLASSSTL